ncbi:hypothetical protein D3C71_2188100 [compost metagenome]
MPMGGVMRPIIMLSTSTTPRCTRSMPSARAVGMNSGTMTSWMVETSRTQPRMRKRMLSSSRKSHASIW